MSFLTILFYYCTARGSSMILTYWYFTSTLVCFTPKLRETRSNALLKRLLAEGGCVLGQGMCVCEVCTRLVCLWWTGQHTQLLLQPCRLWNSYRETTCLSLNSLLPKFIPTHTHTLSHTFSVELDVNAGWGLVFSWARIHLSTSG